MTIEEAAWTDNVLSAWNVVAQSSTLKVKPIGITAFGIPLALARLQNGNAIALQDRCPHRHAPLSQGQITELGIQCPYHGWTFGERGLCTRIPGSLVQCAATNAPRVPNYDLMERDGLVWMRANAQSTTSLPQLVTNTDPKDRRFLWQTLWNAPIVECLENFLDPMHTHFVHSGLVRKETERQSVDVTLTTNEEGFAVDYRGNNTQSGLLYRLFESARVGERAIFAAPGVAQIEYTYADRSVVRITLYFTPRDANTTHVFTSLHVSGRWAPAWAVRWFVWPFLKRVATQDAHILNLQSATRAQFPSQRYVSTENDLVRPYLEQYWNGNVGVELPAVRRVVLGI